MTYIEGPDKLFLLVSEEEVKSHLKGQTVSSLVFWTIVQTLFLLFVCTLVFSHGLWLASLSRLCAFIRSWEIPPFFAKSQQIFH